MQIKVATFVLPKPRIMVVGPTMVGKSVLANAFLGNAPDAIGSPFKVCHGFDTCTKQVTVMEGTAPVEQPTELVVIDTPGFGEDASLDALASMAKSLKEEVKSVDMIVVVFDGHTAKVDMKALAEMQAFFGKVRSIMSSLVVISFHHAPLMCLQEMWKSTAIAVTAMREESAKIDQSWGENLKQKLQKKIHIQNKLPVYILDARALKENDLKQKSIFDR